MKIFVSSYAAACPGEPWDPAAEAALFDGFAAFDLAGLELPFTGRLHAHDEDWLIERLRPEWRFLVTLLPGTMNRLKEDETFGLASAGDGDRSRALDFAEEARGAVKRLNARLGRSAVAAVVLHSAPRSDTPGRSSRGALAESLSTLRASDWHGAELLVEHCDAAVPGQAHDKGFLRLEDELAAIKASSGKTPVRVLINWGRSAIEARSADTPIEHLRQARKEGLLAGVFFSGATPEHPDYGTWKDSHAPFSTSCPSSLLTPTAARAALAEAGTISYLGVKIQPLPRSLGTTERLAMIADGLEAVRTAQSR